MPKKPAAEPASYEQALEELEQLVGRIESGQMPLDQLLAGYQRGADLLAYCRGKLEAVQNQIQVLDNGVLQPWTQD
ncbi:MAG TPA: exodeoxyribonuclease VII small subunit [Giesbergeria sp.]|jgi:exodeoxyribonuclease VII small subunit|uniref:exodeoxyribonuclease VII small subunit n=1 Tax=Comamonadaceae TaxID=80864 RepID=UPI001389CC60|nr:MULTISPECIES: exodeoxyribonuclease VII small subunit [unclassified Acidovorax]MBL8363882.1 exodeoxyribonuclease VII small subunit [Comamonas sp.]MCK6416487.1 exodeoxyribonuclease VII small subunit [Giesbergeria sp.]MCL4769860.1 exodeoxyribonuclease VII small subunit [Burkholderiaceae bacterium]NCU65218.1 exodeoxyribonuclease VII small subunit [Acidovorax sp. 210-6]HMZ85883.1 exodeoxyribonuclease VII small subunit [Giesbergeria sp.]